MTKWQTNCKALVKTIMLTNVLIQSNVQEMNQTPVQTDDTRDRMSKDPSPSPRCPPSAIPTLVTSSHSSGNASSSPSNYPSVQPALIPVQDKITKPSGNARRSPSNNPSVQPALIPVQDKVTNQVQVQVWVRDWARIPVQAQVVSTQWNPHIGSFLSSK